MEIDGRTVIESFVEIQPVTREQQAEWLVNCLTKGDILGYAEHIREEAAKMRGENRKCG